MAYTWYGKNAHNWRRRQDTGSDPAFVCFLTRKAFFFLVETIARASLKNTPPLNLPAGIETKRGMKYGFTHGRVRYVRYKPFRSQKYPGVQGRGGGVVDRRDVLDIMHGRSRMTIDPRIHTMPERSMLSGFSPTMQTLLAPSGKRREV